MKKLITMFIPLMLCASVQAMGFTVWGLTEQATSVNSDNSLTGRVGYYLGSDNGGLELFVGSIWRVNDKAPQVMTLGAVQHMADLLDPNGPIPFIPDLLLPIINENVSIRPYIGGRFTINFIDRDSGLFGGIAGIAVKLSPEANSELVFEGSYDNTFGDLNSVPDNKFKAYMGFRIPF